MSEEVFGVGVEAEAELAILSEWIHEIEWRWGIACMDRETHEVTEKVQIMSALRTALVDLKDGQGKRHARDDLLVNLFLKLEGGLRCRRRCICWVEIQRIDENKATS